MVKVTLRNNFRRCMILKSTKITVSSTYLEINNKIKRKTWCIIGNDIFYKISQKTFVFSSLSVGGCLVHLTFKTVVINWHLHRKWSGKIYIVMNTSCFSFIPNHFLVTSIAKQFSHFIKMTIRSQINPFRTNNDLELLNLSNLKRGLFMKQNVTICERISKAENKILTEGWILMSLIAWSGIHIVFPVSVEDLNVLWMNLQNHVSHPTKNNLHSPVLTNITHLILLAFVFGFYWWNNFIRCHKISFDVSVSRKRKCTWRFFFARKEIIHISHCPSVYNSCPTYISVIF